MSGKLDLRQESFRLLGSLGRRRLAALGEVLLAVSVETPVESIAFSAIDETADAVRAHGTPPSRFACSFRS